MLHVLGLRVRPTVRSAVAAACLRAAYPLWFSGDDAGLADVELEFELGADERASLVGFQERLDAAVLARLSGFAVAHAAAIELDGLLMVFPGPSGSGKSSLVSRLVRQGGNYFSDEYAFIDADGLTHAYPRPPMLRDAHSKRLDSALITSLDRIPRPRRPDVFLFLEHRADEPTAQLRRIDAGAATIGLLRNTPATWVERPGLVRAFARAVVSAAAYEGIRGDVEPGWEAVRNRLMADGILRGVR